jgi:hypothetical protein
VTSIPELRRLEILGELGKHCEYILAGVWQDAELKKKVYEIMYLMAAQPLPRPAKKERFDLDLRLAYREDITMFNAPKKAS